MGIIRKRLATPREAGDEAQGAGPTEADPAQPLDERASSPPVTSNVPVKLSKHASQVTRPLVFVRVPSRPKQLARVNETGAPDWSLSAGVAIVLFGFAIAFGTYVTLNQREAVQAQLHRFARHEEPRPAPQHEPAAPATPATEIAEAHPRPVETTPVPLAASHAATNDTQVSRAASAPVIAVARSRTPQPASAPVITVARSRPPQPASPSINASPAPAPAPAPAKPASKRSSPTATPPAIRQAQKSPVEVSTTTAAHVQTMPSEPREHRATPSAKLANTPCGTLKPCDEVIARDDHVPHEPQTTRPPARTTTATPRETVASVPETPAITLAAPPAQARAQTEATVPLQSAATKALFRQH